MNERLARSWLAARVGSRGLAVNRAFTWLSDATVLMCVPWARARVKGWAKVEPVGLSIGASAASLTTSWLAPAVCRPVVRLPTSALERLALVSTHDPEE